MSAIICGTALKEFTYISPIYASDDDVMTTLIIWSMFNTDSLFLGVSSFSDKKNDILPRFLPWFI